MEIKYIKKGKRYIDINTVQEMKEEFIKWDNMPQIKTCGNCELLNRDKPHAKGVFIWECECSLYKVGRNFNSESCDSQIQINKMQIIRTEPPPNHIGFE